MSLMFVLTACAFVAVVGALVAWVDWWRESRLTMARPVQRTAVQVRRIPEGRKRAA